MNLLTRTGRTRAHAICRCGDPRTAHEHYRSGTECTESGCTCSRFTTMRPWHHGGGTLVGSRHVSDQPRLSPDFVGATARSILD